MLNKNPVWILARLLEALTGGLESATGLTWMAMYSKSLEDAGFKGITVSQDRDKGDGDLKGDVPRDDDKHVRNLSPKFCRYRRCGQRELAVIRLKIEALLRPSMLT